MKLLDLFGKRGKKEISLKVENANHAEEIESYSGMRVEVTMPDGRIFFVAKLLGIHGNEAVLHQYSDAEEIQGDKPLRVGIRGYNDFKKKAVYMEGSIIQMQRRTWQVKELSIVRFGNGRVFFRLATNIDAAVTVFSGSVMGEKPCKLLDISVGGVCIGSQYEYSKNDTFLLKVKLLKDKPESAMFCQVLRITEKDKSKYEYGCRFLELTEEDQERIAQSIYAALRQKKGKF